MKVLTHNMMACTKKQCMGKGFPLAVDCKESEILDQEFNFEFTKNIYPKLDWKGIMEMAQKFNITINPDVSTHSLEDEEFLKSLHHLLCNIKVITGSLQCPNCQRVYQIEKGIPNMLLREDEIYQDIRE